MNQAWKFDELLHSFFGFMSRTMIFNIFYYSTFISNDEGVKISNSINHIHKAILEVIDDSS
jgi:hypothetical protein